MNSVGIVGGGIAGLSAAWKLSELGIPFTLYESSTRLGGMIGSAIREGFLVERGPSTMLQTTPELSHLISALGIEHRRVFPNPQTKRRYVVKGRRLRALPESGLDLVRTPLLSSSGKARVLLELVVRKRAGQDEESLSHFVERRLGREVLDYFVDPFVAGVFAGEPSRLSVAYAFPKLHKLEQDYGSLIVGSLLGARARSRSADKSKLSARMFSFDGGMQVLVDALVSNLKPSVQLGASAAALDRTDSGWQIEFSHGATKTHDAVLLCAPAHQIARMRENSRFALGFLRTIVYPPIARVTLGFRREQIRDPLNGFGLLTPAKEELNSLGIFFSSSLFEGRAPEGHVALNVLLGGSRNPDICGSSTDTIVQAALADVRCLLAAEGEPVFQSASIIARSIPQYELGFGNTKQAMQEFERSSPGLFLAGSYRDGISVSDAIMSGLNSTARVLEYLRNDTPGHSAHQHRVA
jgi:protoporphyrinogen/coproporphyrinogen III oxidase